MKLSLFDYHLPKELIAQKQMKPRDSSRLLVLDKKKKKVSAHNHFYNLDKYLAAGDVLVFNNSKVFPARIRFDKNKEIFLLRELKDGEWEVMIRGKVRTNFELRISNFESRMNLKCRILHRLADGNWRVKFNLWGKKFRKVLEDVGETPLPPYIKIKDSKKIREDYQTIYAKIEGSVAAPTAGLHFTPRLMKKLKDKGVKFEFVTLHVGQGTFQSVKTEKIEEHKMHAEYAELDKETAKRLNTWKREGRKIIAVGTTSARVLEAMSETDGKLRPGAREVNIFIYPGYKFKFVDSLITNFHLPKSTLLMLVSALAGRKFMLEAYQLAVKKKYRFYSFGDGMMIK